MVINPIKEIIFSISFAESVDMDCLNKFTEIPEIKKSFPTIRAGYNANLKAKITGEPPETDVQKSGYVLKSDESSSRILQAKSGMFAFHKTNGYESYSVLISELSFYWEKFNKCAGGLRITNVSLRYLNFIEIGNQEYSTDYVNIWTNSPFPNLNHTFTSLKFQIESDSSTEATIVLTKGKDNGKEGIILDLILNRKFNSEHFENIGDAFQRMREQKNEIFQKCITEKTKKAYNL